MNRLDRFRFGNLHKRRIFSVIAIFILIAFTSASFLAVLGIFGSRSELPRINISANSTRDIVQGVGFNVLDIPDSNIIEDPFFDNEDNCLFATVSSANGNVLYFDPSESGTFSDVEADSAINVLSIDADGSMGIRFSSTLSDFDISRFSVPTIVQDYDSLWNQDKINKTVESCSVVYALTEEGVLIQNVLNDPEVAFPEKSFIDICESNSFVYAISIDGEIYIASEGGSFSYICSVQVSENHSPKFITANNGNVDVFFSDGEVRTVNGNNSYVIGSISASYVESCSQYVVAIDDSNKLFVSSNGLFFEEISCVEESDFVIDARIGESLAYILTNYGTLITVDLVSKEVISCNLSSIEPTSICPASEGKVIAIASDYQAFVADINDGSLDSLGIGNLVTSKVFLIGDNQFLLVSGSSLYQTSLMSALVVADAIGSSAIESGDICMIKTSSVDTSTWDIQGNTHLIGRNNGVQLSGNSDELHVMSRRLDKKTNEIFEDGVFYRIDIAMSSVSGDLDAFVWLEGEEFGQQGMMSTDIANNTDVYSFVFAVTDNMISDEQLRFNIAFEGYGVLNIEYVYVGPSNSDINTIPSDFYNCIIGNTPSTLRFSSMTIGSTGFCDKEFYGVHPDSAERALIMCRDAGSNPWFLMGSQITQSDVDNFLGYLCGSVSSEYGKRRVDNGTALPWSRQFNNIYIEICDSEDAFLSDVQRGAYVDYVKTLFERSPFYVDIMDRIVFVDGMEYEGGVVLSSADRHASSMSISGAITSENSFNDCVYNAIEQARFSSPRSVGGEFISSVSFDKYEGYYTAADVVSCIIQSQNSFADLIMFDSDTEVFDSMASLRFMIERDQLFYEILDPVDTSSVLTAESFSDACDFMLVDGESYLYLVVTNNSDIAQQFVSQSNDFDIRTGSYIRYSSDGELLLQRNINRFGMRHILQPGEYIIIMIPKR